MALAVEWLPEEWPEGIPNLKQLLVVAPLTSSILLLFGCANRNLRTVWPILGHAWRVPTHFGVRQPCCRFSFHPCGCFPRSSARYARFSAIAFVGAAF